MNFDVKGPQKGMRLIPARIVVTTGTPAITEGKYHLTVADGGVGIYNVSLIVPGARATFALATPAASDLVTVVLSPTVTGFQVRVFDASDGTTAKDGDVHLMVVAFDSSDQT